VNTPCRRTFEEALLSGFVDGELTQADEQRVRLHLEDCTRCRGLVDELQALREAAMASRFSEPNPTEWGELPRGWASSMCRSLGWVLVAVWTAATAAYALWQVATSPEGLVVKVLIFGAVAGLGLLLMSVLLDRVRAARTDRYKGVER